MVLGSEEHVLYGPGFIEDELCGLRFRISASSFYQVNPPQAERLYRAAIGMAQLTGKESVLDAYCGVGTIGLAASSQAGRVAGVELNPAARARRLRQRPAEQRAQCPLLCGRRGANSCARPRAANRLTWCSWTRRAPAPSREFLEAHMCGCAAPRRLYLVQPGDAGAGLAVPHLPRLPAQSAPSLWTCFPSRITLKISSPSRGRKAAAARENSATAFAFPCACARPYAIMFGECGG